MADFRYTQEDLDNLTIHDLRIVLCKLGGIPKLKNRQTLIDEIFALQDGRMEPAERTKRGRKPKFMVSQEKEMKRAEAAQRADRAERADRARPYQYTATVGGELIEEPDDDLPIEELTEEVGGGTKSVYNTGGYTDPGILSVSDADGINSKMVEARGVLEIMEVGYGFLRSYDRNSDFPDFYVDRQIIRRYGLRTGDYIVGRAINKFDKSSLNVREVLEINGIAYADFKRGKHFDTYSAVYPDERFVLSKGTKDYALRAIDLLSPVGKGQRALIVAPPKTGKTTLMKKIAQSIRKNYPDVYLIVLLIDERPEEVTDFAAQITKGEVVASTFDETPERHIKFAEIYLERAKRLAECGKDVVILLDSISKLARAYNNVLPSSGKLLSGGVDPQALIFAKKFFGAARNLKNGASITVISTALVETGSRMDDVIFEEFKGTGNMEVVLSRYLSERRIFPAIDLFKSGTRNEEKLFTKEELDGIYKLRKFLSQQDEPAETFLEMVQKTTDNEDLLSRIDAWIKMFG